MPSTTPPPLVLASSSPYRRELLQRLRVPFEVMVPAIDESPTANENPRATALRLSQAKAAALARRRPDAIVIGSDQVAECEGTSIGKPGTHERAVDQLRGLRGRAVDFHSGLCVIAPASSSLAMQADVVTTSVRFRTLTDEEIETYLRIEQPYDCAGSAKAEGLGIALLERIDSDDPTALIGLPLIRLTSMLRVAGLAILGSS